MADDTSLRIKFSALTSISLQSSGSIHCARWWVTNHTAVYTEVYLLVSSQSYASIRCFKWWLTNHTPAHTVLAGEKPIICQHTLYLLVSNQSYSSIYCARCWAIHQAI